MNMEEILIGRIDDACWLTVEEAATLCAVEPEWLIEHLAAGLLPGIVAEENRLAFPAAALARVRRIARLERDFDAVPELAALICDLEEEIARLKARLALLSP